MKNVYLFQPQYAVDIRNQTNYWLPYSAGCLWSYAQQFDVIKQNFVLKDLFFRRIDPQVLVDSMEEPAVCGFSCYVWNKNYCMTLAKMIKKKWPNCIIAVGGPQTNSKLLDTGYVDAVVQAEGEESFVNILEAVHAGKRPEELYIKTRLQELDIPSPYTTGVFDKIIKNTPDAVWAMVLETNRGCPYACTFCDWGSTTYSKVKRFGLERIEEELDWSTKNPVVFIFCADANFGMFKERDVEIAKMIRAAADRGRIESINLQYAKNSTEIIFTIGQIIGDLSKGITVSVQSMHEETLDAIKRKNMSTNNIRHMLELSQKYGVSTYTDTILPLPLETMETFKDGLGELLECGQHDGIDLWFCQLYDNNELSSFESKLKYGIKTVLATDYMIFNNPDDYQEIREDILLINQTNTMNTEEIVESYLYGQMIIHFHIGGYSQLYAKYCRNVLNIPYRKFYDTMFANLFTNATFGEQYTGFKKAVHKYLTQGVLTDDSFDSINSQKTKKGHGLGSDIGRFIYNHRDAAYAFAQQCAENFSNSVHNITEIQMNFVYDHGSVYPKEVLVPYNIKTWEPIETKYSVNTKHVLDKDFNFFRSRHRGFLRNKLVEVHNAI